MRELLLQEITKRGYTWKEEMFHSSFTGETYAVIAVYYNNDFIKAFHPNAFDRWELAQLPQIVNSLLS